ncbi:MAG: rod shape-determining protein MreC, partial [bacterium]|nr:rod shape-determining protein MreC [bacterium]
LARLPREFKVNVGDVVVTSGLGSIFPSGHSFLLGTVTEVVLSSDGLLQTAKVKPSVEFSRLEEVLVLRRKAK